MIARFTPPAAPLDRGRHPIEMSHYARLLVARRGRSSAIVAELDKMAAVMELAYHGGPLDGAARLLSPALLARLVEIEAMPAAPYGLPENTTPAPMPADAFPSPIVEPMPAPRPSGVRPVPSAEQWATAAHQWACGCTHPSAGGCSQCKGSCLCHVGAASAPTNERQEREAV